MGDRSGLRPLTEVPDWPVLLPPIISVEVTEHQGEAFFPRLVLLHEKFYKETLLTTTVYGPAIATKWHIPGLFYLPTFPKR